jgi:GntR family transcriptional repressor for pyruvate dehydrogenase complex
MENIFEPLQRKRLCDEIAEQIKKHIIKKQFRPGDKLSPERELAIMFNVSRPVIREALKILEIAGFIKVMTGAAGGSFIREPNPQLVSVSLEVMFHLGSLEINELIETRRIMEREAAWLAAQRATTENLIEIEHIVREMNFDVNQIGADQKFLTVNQLFHIAVAKAAKNQILLLNIESLRQAIHDLVARIKPRAEAITTAQTYHQQIFEAIKNRDPGTAQSVMDQHLISFEKRLKKMSVETS